MVISHLGGIASSDADGGTHEAPLDSAVLPEPLTNEGCIRLRVRICGVCHTEIDEIEGRTAPDMLPRVPGHQIVGIVDMLGSGVTLHRNGARVGVEWIFDTSGVCAYCTTGLENLCAGFRATGRGADGGYAEYVSVPERSAFPIPDSLSDEEAAPLLCAGAVGYRSLRMAHPADGRPIGFYGFGASAHIVLQMARVLHPESPRYVFTRSTTKQRFAIGLGATWAGAPGSPPPAPPDAIIDTTPVWASVELGMRILAPSGRLVVNAIRKTDEDKASLLKMEYATHLWMEKRLLTVANVSRRDIADTIELAAKHKLTPSVTTYRLDEANRAIRELMKAEGHGAKVLEVAR